MARPLRIQYENACYHVTCRGNGGQDIFLDDGDRRGFLDLLARSVDIYGVRLIAFVLMTNHFHLVVKTPRANLQELMRHFNISYTARFNRKHHRSGHLYQGRYKAFLIDADSYLLEVSRYVHANPVNIAALASAPDRERRRHLRTYQWSSYPDYVSSVRHPFLSPDEVLGYFKGSKSAYRAFVEKGMSTGSPLEKGRGHAIVGDAPFIGDVLARQELAPRREQPEARRALRRVAPDLVLRAVSGHFRIRREEILERSHRGPARHAAMDLLYRHAGMNQREVGELMGVDYSTVSVARKRLRDALQTDRKLQKRLHEVEKELGRERAPAAGPATGGEHTPSGSRGPARGGPARKANRKRR